MAQGLLQKYTPSVGGLTDEDVDMIMRCGGASCKAEITANELPQALSIILSVRDSNKQFHELFSTFDEDKSGTLPADQLLALIAELNGGVPPAESDIVYVLHQLEPRGVADPIAEEQLKAAIACWYCLKRPVHDQIKDMFKVWDKSGDGVIQKIEFMTVMKKLHPEISDADLTMLFDAADQKNNSVLDYQEFFDFLFKGGAPLGVGLETADSPNPQRVKWSTGWLRPSRGKSDAASAAGPADTQIPVANDDETKKVSWSSGGWFRTKNSC